MNILKFGGSSVSSPERIKLVAQIVQEKLNKGQTLVVFSAFGGVTDDLLRMAELATLGGSSYKDLLERLEARHLEAVRELLPVQMQSQVLSQVKTELNQLETLYEGISLLNELSGRTRHVISGFGESLTTRIITAYYRSL